MIMKNKKIGSLNLSTKKKLKEKQYCTQEV